MNPCLGNWDTLACQKLQKPGNESSEKCWIQTQKSKLAFPRPVSQQCFFFVWNFITFHGHMKPQKFSPDMIAWTYAT
jgi:hypothetical protein